MCFRLRYQELVISLRCGITYLCDIVACIMAPGRQNSAGWGCHAPAAPPPPPCHRQRSGDFSLSLASATQVGHLVVVSFRQSSPGLGLSGVQSLRPESGPPGRPQQPQAPSSRRPPIIMAVMYKRYASLSSCTPLHEC